MHSLKKTLVLTTDPDKPDDRVIGIGAKLLRNGGLVAFPTETVYGIAANLLDKAAIARLHKVKKRPSGKPYTVHIASASQIKDMGCTVTKEAKTLIDRFWPGPLTIILKSKKGKKIGFRMPDNNVALALIKEAAVPVVAPSANISGHSAPKTAKEVLKELAGKIDIVIDAGHTDIGIESAVVDLSVKHPKVLREGAIGAKKILGIIANE